MTEQLERFPRFSLARTRQLQPNSDAELLAEAERRIRVEAQRGVMPRLWRHWLGVRVLARQGTGGHPKRNQTSFTRKPFVSNIPHERERS